MPIDANIGIPLSEYDQINTSAACTKVAENALHKFMQTTPYRRILLFGAGQTGQSVRKFMQGRFAGFVKTATLQDLRGDEGDCVLITTAPIHVDNVERTLAASPLAHLPVIRLFATEELNIRLILETQPRCGTGYTIRNLQNSLGLGYATTFRVEGGLTTKDGLAMYKPKECNGYVVKAHFTKTLHYPQYRFIPTLFLIGYFSDTYYRWARMIANQKHDLRDEYFLKYDSPEWSTIQAYIPLHLKWLTFIRDKSFIRYEDYFINFDGVMNIFESLLGTRPDNWEKPMQITNRLYWTRKPEKVMDQKVQATLDKEFANHIRHFYPECN